MAHRGRSLEALYNRRREIENNRNNQKKALSNYYNHWAEVNNRFNNWTTQKYYEKADAQLKKIKDLKTKEKALSKRREHLNSLFATEDSDYGAAIRKMEKRRPRRLPVDDETLIQEALRDKRKKLNERLEMRAKLHGTNESKLNINKEYQSETEKATTVAEQERNLAMQEERQKKRFNEINEIRAIQEKCIDELRESQNETDALQEEERKLHSSIDDIEKELALLHEKCAVVLQPSALGDASNIKKVKPYLLKRCNIFHNNIKESIKFLDQMRAWTNKSQEIDEMLKKYRTQEEIEKLSLEQIEGMFESEAKYNLKDFEELWQLQLLDRYEEMKDLLKEEITKRNAELDENLKNQAYKLEARNEQIASIEDSNQKLDELFAEQENSARSKSNSTLSEKMVDATTTTTSNFSDKKNTMHAARNCNISNTFDSRQAASILTHDSDYSAPTYRPLKKLRPVSSLADASCSVPSVSNSLRTLNLDGPETAANVSDKVSLKSQSTVQVETADILKRPMFGRKRITWN